MKPTARSITCILGNIPQDQLFQLEQLAKDEADLDRVVMDRAVTGLPTRLVQTETPHRLGDCFESVQVRVDGLHPSKTLRLTFRIHPHADRYWKDIMVSVLQSLTNVCPSVSVISMGKTLD